MKTTFINPRSQVAKASGGSGPELQSTAGAWDWEASVQLQRRKVDYFFVCLNIRF